MPRSSVITPSPSPGQSPSLPNQDSRLILDHRAGIRPPVSFIEEQLVNGNSLRIATAARQPWHARVIQRVAALARGAGGFHAFCAGPLLRARMQFSAIDDVHAARQRVLQVRNQLIGFANSLTTTPTARSGSCRQIEVHVRHSSEGGTLLELDLLIEVSDRSDVGLIDAMIAKMAPLIEQLTHGSRGCIAVSGIAAPQLLCAQLTLDAACLPLPSASASALAMRLVDLHDFICTDAARLNTLNKQVLGAANAVHAAAGVAERSTGHGLQPQTAHSGKGAALAVWYHDHHGYLSGRIALPLQIAKASAGAAAPAHASASLAAEAIRKVLPIEHAAAAIALAQSLACLHAHASGAIMKSSPAQHAHDLALLAGARGSEIRQLVQTILSGQSFRFDHAVVELDRLREQ